eukprot:5731062-Pyramimonas_sp.AAC.1
MYSAWGHGSCFLSSEKCPRERRQVARGETLSRDQREARVGKIGEALPCVARTRCDVCRSAEHREERCACARQRQER